jgi:hypothetical protein
VPDSALCGDINNFAKGHVPKGERENGKKGERQLHAKDDFVSLDPHHVCWERACLD